MKEKKVLDIEDLMIDYGEMTGFDFNSLDYKETRRLRQIVSGEYSEQPAAFKYGNFNFVDLIHSFITQKDI